jgi:hypothetical protein
MKASPVKSKFLSTMCSMAVETEGFITTGTMIYKIVTSYVSLLLLVKTCTDV